MNNIFRHSLWTMLGLILLLCVGGCDNPSNGNGDEPGPETSDPAVTRGSGEYTLKDTIVFYSLAQGKEIDASKSATTEWDIAIEAKNGFCYIYTNSGVSAQEFGTSGQGGVWFTDKTDFTNTSFEDRVTDFSGENAEYAPYVTDVTRYQIGMSASLGGVMNIMTYFGYASGDGLTEQTAFGWSSPGPPSYPFYEFNKKAFAYVTGGMPPPWGPTRQVYIIRHADGISYSKFQVSALRYQVSYTFILRFRFETLKTPEISPQFTPGTYTARATGYGGPLSLTTDISANSIDRVAVTDHSETSSRPAVQTALASIPAAIVAAQRLDVNAVSGATGTSNAIRQAVEDCVVQAGGNPADLKIRDR